MAPSTKLVLQNEQKPVVPDGFYGLLAPQFPVESTATTTSRSQSRINFKNHPITFPPKQQHQKVTHQKQWILHLLLLFRGAALTADY